MFDSHTYTIVVKRVRVDDEDLFRSTVQELPDIETYGETHGEAYELAIDAIEGLAAIAEEEGRPFPAPQEIDSDYSGRVTLRMPKGLHQKIAIAATIEGVSLNHYLVAVLAYAANAGSTYFIGTSGNASITRHRTIGEDWRVVSGAPRIVSLQYDTDVIAEQAKSKVMWKTGRSLARVTVHEDKTYPSTPSPIRVLNG